MKLFVWKDVLCDFTCGMAIVYAKDEEAAKRLMEEKFPHYVRAQLPFSEVEVRMRNALSMSTEEVRNAGG